MEHANPPANLPLSVLLFNAAMNNDLPISDFAEKLGIGAISLRQFISGKTQRPRTKTLDAISALLGIPLEDARRRAGLPPGDAPPFSQWLKDQMDDRFSRAKLTRDTGISDGALRNYLSGQTLPDSDQANRLAQALDISSLEIARVIVANQVERNGGQLAPISEEPAEEEEELSAAPPAHPLALTPEPRFEAAADERQAIGTSGTPALTPVPVAPHTPAPAPVRDEEHLVHLWRQLHPQGRRATLTYIASLLAEG